MLKIEFNPKILKKFFSYKVRESCKSCKRYGKKTCCPPNIETIEYYNYNLPMYKHGILVIENFPIGSYIFDSNGDKIWNSKDWKQLGEDSSNIIKKELITIRQDLLNNNHPVSIIFGAGSCKNCDECSIPCKFPDKMLIPIEGTGLNVIQLVKKVTKIDIKFPVEIQRNFHRIGMCLYD